jgi:hypothetical protein
VSVTVNVPLRLGGEIRSGAPQYGLRSNLIGVEPLAYDASSRHRRTPFRESL